ncbi:MULTISPECIES: DinB family protein [Micromonospora]|uniref:DinB superfamily protein n=1 Tax=Micromonospora yangpuensis TaxID=683228 RepID=A0A1C6UVN5_9ACTN|nr:hypothetical protein GCM10012279_50460 [Micromonospora yangpuensis]SCL58115.1 Protein of unknown function [Micromonospora yangpuensis]
MGDPDDLKTELHQSLRTIRENLIWKLDGVSERAARLPRTATGNNLLGIVKHCLNVEASYFGPTFGRDFPTPDELVALQAFDEDPQADWYARHDETRDGLIDLYRRVGVFADQTIDQLPLDAPGRVSWWPPGSQTVTLRKIILHVTWDLTRHAGHADILREQHDATIGLGRTDSNIPDDYDWQAYVTKLTALADQVGDSPAGRG